MRSTVSAAALSVLIGLVPAIGLAQTPGASASSAAVATPPAPAAAAPAAAPSASASAAPVIPATGYGWSDPKQPPKPAHRAPRASHRPDAPNATMSGFESLADGSTRLFVELSRPVTYEAKSGRGMLTYLLKGAYTGRRNNYNPLVTVHFNTPVTSARLVPEGHDLKLVIKLRAKVEPTVTMDAGKNGSSVMHIDFPKGDYLPPPGPATKTGKTGKAAATANPDAPADNQSGQVETTDR